MSMSTQCGGILRGVAWMAAALGAFLLVVALFAYRGGDIQKDLQETGGRIRAKLPEIEKQLADLSDLPDLPGLPAGRGGPADEQAPGVPTDAAARRPTEDQVDTEQTDAGEVRAQEPDPEPKGPNAGVGPADDHGKSYTVQDPPPVARARHKVSRGETLYTLAETYYEDGRLWRLIARANNLKDPADLREGMVVVIPGK
jgi:nucleoid-associated protein YgaU